MKTINTLSFLRPSTWSSTVAPLPEHHSFTSQFTAFDNLKLSLEERKTDETRVTSNDLLENVVGLIMVHKEMLSANDLANYDPNSINEYLDDGVEMLDVCKFLLGKIEFVKRYVNSVERATRLIYSGMGSANVTRVKRLLDLKKCSEEEDSNVSMDKCWSRLKRLMVKEKRRRQGESDSLTRSLTDALYTCKRLDTALSLKRSRRSSVEGCTGQMVELTDFIILAKKLRDLTAEEAAEVDKRYVKKKCDEVVYAVERLEEKVKELYSQLVSIRMSLLGNVSYQSYFILSFERAYQS